MRTILLHGELGKRFGFRHSFDVKNVAESIRALCANFPKFQSFMTDSNNSGVGYRVLVNKTDIESLDKIADPIGKASIRIVPVISGSGAGFKIFLGAALITASFFTGGATLLPGLALAGVASGIGLALVLGGIAQLVAPTIDSDDPNANDKPSYLFNGPVNTTAQGNPVPIGYGRLIVGSAVISAGITIDDISSDAHEINTDQALK